MVVLLVDDEVEDVVDAAGRDVEEDEVVGGEDVAAPASPGPQARFKATINNALVRNVRKRDPRTALRSMVPFLSNVRLRPRNNHIAIV